MDMNNEFHLKYQRIFTIKIANIFEWHIKAHPVIYTKTAIVSVYKIFTYRSKVCRNSYNSAYVPSVL